MSGAPFVMNRVNFTDENAQAFVKAAMSRMKRDDSEALIREALKVLNNSQHYRGVDQEIIHRRYKIIRCFLEEAIRE